MRNRPCYGPNSLSKEDHNLQVKTPCPFRRWNDRLTDFIWKSRLEKTSILGFFPSILCHLLGGIVWSTADDGVRVDIQPYGQFVLSWDLISTALKASYRVHKGTYPPKGRHRSWPSHCWTRSLRDLQWPAQHDWDHQVDRILLLLGLHNP